MYSDVRFPHFKDEPEKRPSASQPIVMFLVVFLSACAVDRFGIGVLFKLLHFAG